MSRRYGNRQRLAKAAGVLFSHNGGPVCEKDNITEAAHYRWDKQRSMAFTNGLHTFISGHSLSQTS